MKKRGKWFVDGRRLTRIIQYLLPLKRLAGMYPSRGAAAPDKYADELLDAYVRVEDVDALYAEYAANGVEFTREVGNMPWHAREFVVKDCDGRLLAFGQNL